MDRNAAINTPPIGLLSLLGIKSVGFAPAQLPEQVTPTIDLDPFYYYARARSVTGLTGLINNVGAFPTTAGEWTNDGLQLWYCPWVTANYGAALAAGTTYRISLAAYDTRTGQTYMCGPSETFTAGEAPNVGFRDVWVPPQKALIVWCHRYTAGTPQQFSIQGIRCQLDI